MNTISQFDQDRLHDLVNRYFQKRGRSTPEGAQLLALSSMIGWGYSLDESWPLIESLFESMQPDFDSAMSAVLGLVDHTLGDTAAENFIQQVAYFVFFISIMELLVTEICQSPRYQVVGNTKVIQRQKISLLFQKMKATIRGVNIEFRPTRSESFPLRIFWGEKVVFNGDFRHITDRESGLLSGIIREFPEAESWINQGNIISDLNPQKSLSDRKKFNAQLEATAISEVNRLGDLVNQYFGRLHKSAPSIAHEYALLQMQYMGFPPEDVWPTIENDLNHLLPNIEESISQYLTFLYDLTDNATNTGFGNELRRLIIISNLFELNAAWRFEKDPNMMSLSPYAMKIYLTILILLDHTLRGFSFKFPESASSGLSSIVQIFWLEKRIFSGKARDISDGLIQGIRKEFSYASWLIDEILSCYQNDIRMKEQVKKINKDLITISYEPDIYRAFDLIKDLSKRIHY